MSSKLVIALAVAGSLLAAAPHRIISLTPSTTEILYGVGAFSNVVAVSQYCTYPPAVRKLPRVGGFETTEIEKIVALRPDLVALIQPQQPFISDKLRAFGIPEVAVPSESLEDVYTAMRMVGDATDHKQQAQDLIAKTRASLDGIRGVTKDLPRRTVLLCVNRTPGTLDDLYVATKGSYLIDLIEIAGGKSVAAPTRTGYGKLTKEAILALNPEIIIDLIHESGARFGGHAMDAWKDMPELSAVREKHVYPLDDDTIVHPSQFVAHTAQLFLGVLHPEAAGKVQH